MKIFLASMIRNEMDILPEFLNHVDAIFDSGCLVDHLSSDGSEALLQKFVRGRDFSYRQLQTPAFPQADLSCELLNEAFESGADAVCFLDADEFIADLDRGGLEDAVKRLARERSIGQLRWRNCAPGEYRERFELDQPAWHCGLSRISKLLCPRWVHDRYPGQVRVSQGNHSVLLPDGEPAAQQQVAELLHFPVRSRKQFEQKIATAYQAQTLNRDRPVALHVQANYELLAWGELTPEIMNAIALDYGKPLAARRGISAAQLKELGFRLQVPRVSVGACLKT